MEIFKEVVEYQQKLDQMKRLGIDNTTEISEIEILIKKLDEERENLKCNRSSDFVEMIERRSLISKNYIERSKRNKDLNHLVYEQKYINGEYSFEEHTRKMMELFRDSKREVDFHERRINFYGNLNKNQVRELKK